MAQSLQFLIPAHYNNKFVTAPVSCETSDDIEVAFDGSDNYAYISYAVDEDEAEIVYNFVTEGDYLWLYLRNIYGDATITPTIAEGSVDTDYDDGLYLLDNSDSNDLTLTLTRDSTDEEDTIGIQNIIVGKAFSVPMQDHGYSISYSFNNSAYGLFGGGGKEFINFALAKKLLPIETRSYSWSGLTSAEKDVFVDILTEFGESYKPFILIHWLTSTTYEEVGNFVITNTPTISRDVLDLWSISFTLRSMANGATPSITAEPEPDDESGWGWSFGTSFGGTQ